MFSSRLINVMVGCGVGFGLLLIGGRSDWMLPFALAATVLISSYVIRVKTMWRQAPDHGRHRPRRRDLPRLQADRHRAAGCTRWRRSSSDASWGCW